MQEAGQSLCQIVVTLPHDIVVRQELWPLKLSVNDVETGVSIHFISMPPKTNTTFIRLLPSFLPGSEIEFQRNCRLFCDLSTCPLSRAFLSCGPYSALSYNLLQK